MSAEEIPLPPPCPSPQAGPSSPSTITSSGVYSHSHFLHSPYPHLLLGHHTLAGKSDISKSLIRALPPSGMLTTPFEPILNRALACLLIMSLLRALLLFIQVPCYQIASTPPNKTPEKGRYDAATPWHLRIASSVIQAQQPIVWVCTLADLLLIVLQQSFFPIPTQISQTVQATICPFPSSSPLPLTTTNGTSASFSTPSPAPSIQANSLSLLGLGLVMFGTFIRFTCYKTLGALFTFDLSIMPKHKLITWGPYAFVRHPAYSGSLCVMLGLALINLTRGSWVAECGVLGFGSEWIGRVVRVTLFVVWYAWWISVGVHRADLEDGVLKKLFGQEWDAYSKRVTSWFVPGIF